MTINVELRDKTRKALGAPRLVMDVAAPFLDERFGKNWRHADLPILMLWPYPYEDNRIYGDQPLDYQTEAIGFIQVRIGFAGRVSYRHPHTVAEVLEPGLRRWMEELGAAVKPVAYRITGPEIDPLVHQSTPIPKWVTEVAPYAPGEQPAFRIRPIPPTPPALSTLGQFGAIAPQPEWSAQAGHTDFIEVVVNDALHDTLLKRHPFSADAEEGGFLVGQVYENRERPGSYIAHVVDAVPAEQVGASFLHFTFTGDSFDRIKQRLATEHQGQRLLGWYHTHLFPANETMGLSSIDLRLHFTTFRIPWQIAGLLNLDGGNRVLRFYVRQGDTMALCRHQPTSRP